MPWTRSSHNFVSFVYCLTSAQKRSLAEKRSFSTFCYSILKDRRCLPFDSTEPTSYSADFPSNLYLDSAELNMFGNLGNFYKVSKSVHQVGVTDDFLLSLGVRKSVSIDFLFENLHTLNYTDDPKPLVDYLRSATLTKADLHKLSNCQYLPAENDRSRMFAPGKITLTPVLIFLFCSIFYESQLAISQHFLVSKQRNYTFQIHHSKSFLSLDHCSGLQKMILQNDHQMGSFLYLSESSDCLNCCRF